MSLHDAHELSGRVKWAIRNEVTSVAGVLVHMEPFEDAPGSEDDARGGAAAGHGVDRPPPAAQSTSRKTS
jgi:hypothetical protein